MQALAIIAAALTALSLLLMLRTWRKETRVRTWLDSTRLVITAATIAGMIVLLSVATPVWLGAAAFLIGLFVGLGQGRGLKIRFTERGPVSRRTVLGLLATGVGIVTIQVASTLNRAGIVRIGLTVSFISLGIMLGLIVGRRRPLRVARSAPGRAAAAAAVVVALAAGGLATGAPSAQSQGLPCPTSVGELVLGRVLEGTDPAYAFVICKYQPPDDLRGVVSGAGISVRWSPEFVSGATNERCQGGGQRTEPLENSGFSIYQYSPVATALTEVHIDSPNLRYDETALDIAADALLARAEILAASCEPEPPGGRFANRGPLPVPGFRDAVPKGVAELSGGIVDLPAFMGSDLAGLEAAGMRGIARNEVTVRITEAGGSIEGLGILATRWDDASLDIALYKSLGGSDPGYVPEPCFYLFGLTYEINGIYDVASGALTGQLAYAGFPVTIISGCESTSFDPPEGAISLSFEGVFDGSEARISASTTVDGTPITFVVVARDGGLSAGELGVSVGGIEFVGEEALFDETGTAEIDQAISDVSDEDLDFFADLFADDVEISADDAAMAALLGLLGISALAISQLLEAGISTKDLIEAASELEDDEATPRGTSEPSPALVDEDGDELKSNEDGLYGWEVDGDTRMVDRAEAVRLIAEARWWKEFNAADAESRVRMQQDRSDVDLSELGAKTSAEAAAYAATEEANRGRREKTAAWFDKHPEYGHLWERSIRADGSVDLELMRQIMGHQQRGSLPEPDDQWWALDGLESTMKEIFTGQEADGSISWNAMALRALLNASSGGAAEWIYTPSDALARMKDAVDKGDMRDWNEIASDATKRAIFDEMVGRVLAGGLQRGIGALARKFPGLAKDVGEFVESLGKKLKTPIGGPRLPLDADLTAVQRRLQDALKSGDDDALRALYQNGGMKKLAKLEAGGYLSAGERQALLGFHDRVTGDAVEQGTKRAISDWTTGREGIPEIKSVYVGNSGSGGPLRSVKTDADRTFFVLFDKNQLADYATARGIDPADAQTYLQAQFKDMQFRRASAALNPSGTKVPLDAVRDLDMANYSGIGSGAGPTDVYPIGFTMARQSAMGKTQIFRPQAGGSVRVTNTGGDALLDQMVLEQRRLGVYDPKLGRKAGQIYISTDEGKMLLAQQMASIENATDIKTVAKAASRGVKAAGLLDSSLPDDELAQMARQIRARPDLTSQILDEHGMDEAQAVDALKEMMGNFDASLGKM
ncbi:MAG: hypothetical protein BMS9Abin20_0514 [Acidimicrobiia bacterium]|nr:MAG: hypothetical protein BMS9Abin20_0514 [Acidimicrobiia bacterium]